MEKFYKTNLKYWNELVGIHSKSRHYDLEGFLKGEPLPWFARYRPAKAKDE